MDFVVAGRVRGVEYYDKDTDTVLTKPVQMTTLDEVVAYIENEEHIYENILLDMSPFEVRVFDKSKKGCMQLHAAVKELGFLLSEREEEAWKKYMRRWDDD